MADNRTVCSKPNVLPLQIIRSENAANVQFEIWQLQSSLLIPEALKQKMFLVTCILVVHRPLLYEKNSNFKYLQTNLCLCLSTTSLWCNEVKVHIFFTWALNLRCQLKAPAALTTARDGDSHNGYKAGWTLGPVCMWRQTKESRKIFRATRN
jgi:hypothetical protein